MYAPNLHAKQALDTLQRFAVKSNRDSVSIQALAQEIFSSEAHVNGESVSTTVQTAIARTAQSSFDYAASDHFDSLYHVVGFRWPLKELRVETPMLYYAGRLQAFMSGSEHL